MEENDRPPLRITFGRHLTRISKVRGTEVFTITLTREEEEYLLYHLLEKRAEPDPAA